MSTTDIINIILTSATIIIAIIALIQSVMQIKISNKQSLFEKRVEKYLLIDNLFNLYSLNKDQMDNCYRFPDTIAILLTNNTYLADMCNAMKDTLVEDKQKVFLSKIEYLKNNALEISLLWKKQEGLFVKDFINNYADLLFALYQQESYIKRLEKDKTFDNNDFDSFENKIIKMSKTINLNEILDKLESSYKDVYNYNCLDTLKKEIKL